jgi:lysylphosphatidylglycerol synthetase-like protein (DUF2156 family)
LIYLFGHFQVHLLGTPIFVLFSYLGVFFMIVFVLLIVYLPIYKFIKNKSPLIWGFFFGGGEGGFMIYPLIWLPISTLILRLFSYLGIFQDF